MASAGTSAPNVSRTPLIEQYRALWTSQGWDDHADVMATMTGLHRATNLFVTTAERALSPTGLSYSSYSVLILLMFNPEHRMPLSRIARRLRVHPTNITGVIDRLQKKGLVERVPHETDRRTTLAVITDTGLQLAHDAAEILNKAVFDQVPGLTSKQARDLQRLLTLLITAHDHA